MIKPGQFNPSYGAINPSTVTSVEGSSKKGADEETKAVDVDEEIGQTKRFIPHGIGAWDEDEQIVDTMRYGGPFFLTRERKVALIFWGVVFVFMLTIVLAFMFSEKTI